MFRIAEEIRIGKMFNQLNKIVMKVYSEITLTSFEFWGGAKDRAKMLSYEELEEAGNVLEDIYEKEVEDVTINNLF